MDTLVTMDEDRLLHKAIQPQQVEQVCQYLHDAADRATRSRLQRTVAKNMVDLDQPQLPDATVAAAVHGAPLAGIPVPPSDPPTVYHSVAIPGMPLAQLASVVERRGQLGPDITLMAVALMKRAFRAIGASRNDTDPCAFMIHRLYTVCVYVTQKVFLDVSFTASTFAKVCGLSARELTRGELNLAKALDWRLRISRDDVLQLVDEAARDASCDGDLAACATSAEPPSVQGRTPRQPTANDGSSPARRATQPSTGQSTNASSASPSNHHGRSTSTASSGSAMHDDKHSNSSRITRGSRRSGESHHGGGVAMGAVGADMAIVTRQVSVIAANLVGLHRLATEPDVLLAEIAAATEAMDDAVASRRGALTFHGDRFLATFNAAKPCAGHAVKAASAAVAAVSAHSDRHGVLQLSAGVASGACTVGPMGSATVKALSTVGLAVSTAGLLERLAARECHGAVLAVHRTAAEAASSLVVEYVDLVNVPGAPRPLAVAALTHPNKRPQQQQEQGADEDNDEWMYVMAKEGSLYNLVFEELHRGHVTAAIKSFEELQQAATTAGPESSPPPRRLLTMMEELRTTLDAGVRVNDAEEEGKALVRVARALEFSHYHASD